MWTTIFPSSCIELIGFLFFPRLHITKISIKVEENWQLWPMIQLWRSKRTPTSRESSRIHRKKKKKFLTSNSSRFHSSTDIDNHFHLFFFLLLKQIQHLNNNNNDRMEMFAHLNLHRRRRLVVVCQISSVSDDDPLNDHRGSLARSYEPTSKAIHATSLFTPNPLEKIFFSFHWFSFCLEFELNSKWNFLSNLKSDLNYSNENTNKNSNQQHPE